MSEPTTTALPPGLPNDLALDEGATYRVPRSAIGRGIRFTSPADGTTGAADRGVFALYADEGETQLLFAMIDQSFAQVFTDPAADFDTLLAEDTIADAVQPAPADYLAYFSSLPGVEASAPVADEILGFAGQSVTWTVTAVDQGVPCLDVADQNCLLAMWGPIGLGGVLIHFRAGDTGKLYVVTVDDRTFNVFVTDRPTAQAAIDSFEITES